MERSIRRSHQTKRAKAWDRYTSYKTIREMHSNDRKCIVNGWKDEDTIWDIWGIAEDEGKMRREEIIELLALTGPHNWSQDKILDWVFAAYKWDVEMDAIEEELAEIRNSDEDPDGQWDDLERARDILDREGIMMFLRREDNMHWKYDWKNWYRP